MRTIPFAVGLCALLLAPAWVRAAEFDLGSRGTLVVAVPEAWSINGRAVPGIDGKCIGYTMIARPRGGTGAKCIVSFLYLTNGAPNLDAIRTDALRIGDVFVDGSVERKETLREFSLEHGYGAYCLFTDASLVGKNPGPDDFKVMGVGEVQPAENMLGTVSLLANAADGPEFKTMVQIINSLKIRRTGIRAGNSSTE